MRWTGDILRRRVARDRLAVMLAVLWAAGPAAAWMRAGPADSLDVRVYDEYGVAASGGSVLFCPEAGECREYPVSASGIVVLAADDLEAGVVYTVIVYDTGGVVRSMTSTYVHDDAELERSPGALPPQLRGDARHGLVVDLGGVGPPDASSPPTGLLLAVSVPVMMGESFGADPDALGGVMSVEPGVGLVGSLRFGMPTAPRRRRGGVGFHALTVCYAQNRYTTRQIRAPGEESDLTFHRVSLAYGRGRLSRRSLLSVSAAVAYGGIYDGGTILDHEGRTYRMVGYGLQGRFVQTLVGTAGRAIGLMVQAELMDFPAGDGDADHWHGLAPSVALGVAVR